MSNLTTTRAAIMTPCLVMFAVAAISAQVQEPKPPLPVDPRPLAELLTDQERASLPKAVNPKETVQSYLKIASTHLNGAMNAIDRDDHVTAERELDIYNKAITESGNIAFSQTKDRRKFAKIIEQQLLRHAKLLEAIERRFPVERSAFADAAKDTCHRLRVRALNEAFAGGDILKPPDDESQPAVTEKPGKSPGGGFRFTSLHVAGTSKQSTVDYMNEEENVIVREAQEIDDRLKVFMKIADRRLAAIIGPGKQTDKEKKESEKELLKWGPLPQLSRSELLNHYALAIDEAIAKIEDSVERNPKSTKLTRALKTLLEAAETHLKILSDLESALNGEQETRALKNAIDRAKTAIDGAREGLKGR